MTFMGLAQNSMVRFWRSAIQPKSVASCDIEGQIERRCFAISKPDRRARFCAPIAIGVLGCCYNALVAICLPVYDVREALADGTGAATAIWFTPAIR
jgi:hypothetical protein